VILCAAAWLALAAVILFLFLDDAHYRVGEAEHSDVTDAPQVVEAQYDEVVNIWAGKRPADQTDLLRPGEEKLRRAFWAVLDEMREKDVRPTVTMRTQVSERYKSGVQTHTYVIDLPLMYRRFNAACSRRNPFAGYYWALCQEALYTPAYAYYVTVLVLAPGFKELYRLPALTERKPELWDEQHTNIVPRVTGWPPHNPSFSVPFRKGAPPMWWHYEKYCRIRELLDPSARSPSNDGEYSLPSYDDGRVIWWRFPQYREWLQDGGPSDLREAGIVEARRTGDAVVETDPGKRADLITALPHDQVQQNVWVLFFCSASDTDSPRRDTARDRFLVTRALVAYFHAAPKPTPLYTDMAMALFVSRGYDFDRKTGMYTLNKVGELLLDYVVEHVRQNVMEHLTILNDRGCDALLDRMVAKHHPKFKTWDKFQEAFASTEKPHEKQEEE
jgi:hypothetical protein